MSPRDHPNLPFETFSGRPMPPLPDHFEPELHRLDESVGEVLRREHAAHQPPADLIERIYEASVSELPKRPVLRLVGSRPMPAARRVARLVTTGRLAAAAAILLAVLVSVPFMARNGANPGADSFANGRAQPVGLRDREVPDWYTLSPELQIVLAESLASDLNDFSYLVETRDATLDDLNNELLDVLDELEAGRDAAGWDAG